MKYLYAFTLLICTLCLTNVATAQKTNPESAKKVVIVKKSVDEDGNVVVEKIVRQGDDVEILTEDVIGDDVEWIDANENVIKIRRTKEGDEIKELRFEKAHDAPMHLEMLGSQGSDDHVNLNVNNNDGHRTITIEKSGHEPVVIELAEGESLSDEHRVELAEIDIELLENESGDITMSGDRIAFISDVEIEADGIAPMIHRGISRITERLADFDFDNDFDFDFEFESDAPRVTYFHGPSTINCAALGVYVNTGRDGELRIQSIIGSSGAESAGLQDGDVITALDKTPVGTHRELLHAIGQYEPGDRVTVDYEREGETKTVQVELTSWKALPSFADRPHAQVDCNDKNFQNSFDFFQPIVNKKVIIIKKGQDAAVEEVESIPENINRSPVDNTLELTDFMAYPNPTDGNFKVEFRAEPQPTVITLLDVSGREIFRERLDDFSGWYAKDIDLRDNAPGAFILTVEQDGKLFTEQIIRQ